MLLTENRLQRCRLIRNIRVFVTITGKTRHFFTASESFTNISIRFDGEFRIDFFKFSVLEHGDASQQKQIKWIA